MTDDFRNASRIMSRRRIRHAAGGPFSRAAFQWPASVLICLLFFTAFRAHPGEMLIFEDNFAGHLGPGWSWIREHAEAWRIGENALEVRIEPGNMWGPANDARNLLVRPAPDLSEGPVEISVTVSNRPTSQYEQVDLVWYYDDSNMVKLGHELVDGKLSIVMGQEKNDRTRTIAIIPITAHSVRLRHRVERNRLRGEFLLEGSDAWITAGESDLPSTGQPARIGLQFYQGPPQLERWARVSNLRIVRISK
jgi:regulation of enolase protein 1 (concanavalin A-like superfamily)